MRIANKILRTDWLSSVQAALIVTLSFAPLGTALAANAPMPVMPSLAVPAAAPVPMPDVAMAPPIGAAPSPAAMPASNDMIKNVTAMEDKATDGAKSTIKNLDGNETLTLEDLNRARQTVSRIDAMIEVEKRLGELQKLRDSRNGVSSASLAGAIPASALSPAGNRKFGGGTENSGFPVMAGQGNPIVMRAPASTTEISRIVGSDGKYSAVIKTDGGTRTVRVGDQLNGGTVRWITSSAMGLDERGQTRTLHVKNVDLVTNAMR